MSASAFQPGDKVRFVAPVPFGSLPIIRHLPGRVHCVESVSGGMLRLVGLSASFKRGSVASSGFRLVHRGGGVSTS